MITHDPLHRSGQAALPHPALAWGDNAQADERVGVTDAGGRKPPGDVPRHPAPGEPMGLAAAQEHATPQPPHGPTEEPDGRAVHGHAVIPDVPTDDRAQIGPLLRDREMHAPRRWQERKTQRVVYRTDARPGSWARKFRPCYGLSANEP